MNFCRNYAPDGIEMKKMKQVLMVKNPTKLRRTLKDIYTNLSKDEFIDRLMKSDMVEFLCDALLSADVSSIRMIYCCLGVLTKKSQFYNETNYPSLCILSIMKSLNTILGEKKDEKKQKMALCVISNILTRCTSKNILLDRSICSKILKYISFISTNSLPTDIHYKLGSMMKYFLQFPKLNTNCISSMLNVIQLCMKHTGDYGQYKENMDVMIEKQLKLNFNISLLFFDFYTAARKYEKNDTPQMKKTLNDILKFIIDFGTLYVSDLPSSSYESSHEELTAYFTCLARIYSVACISESDLIRYSHSLATNFLHFIPEILSWLHNNKCMIDLEKICRLVLAELIINLSIDVFQLQQNNKLSEFTKDIHTGIKQLPMDVSQWFSILADTRTTRPCKLFLIIYFYYYSLTTDSPDMIQPIYPYLITFLLRSSGLSSVVLVKSTWLLFAMSQLAKGDPVEGENLALKKITHLLSCYQDLSSVYTHHPAILYWCFSSKLIPKKLQYRAVLLWLQKRSSDCKELQHIVKANSSLQFTLLDIVMFSKSKNVNQAVDILHEYILSNESDQLVNTIWYLIPRVLIKFNKNGTNVKNVEVLCKLANIKPPASYDKSPLIQAASHLPKLLMKNNLKSTDIQRYLYSLTEKILSLSVESGDYRVAKCLTRSSRFIEHLIQSTSQSDEVIVHQCLRILNTLAKCNRVHSDFPPTDISSSLVLKLLKSTSYDVLYETLHLLQLLLVSNFKSTFIHLDVTSDFIRQLFLILQHLCMKDIPELKTAPWLCLTSCLKYNYSEKLTNHLTTQPWTHDLLKMVIPSSTDRPEMMQFVQTWLDCNRDELKPRDVSSFVTNTRPSKDVSRRLGEDDFTQTVKNLTQQLGALKLENEPQLVEKILHSKAELSTECRNSLTQKLKPTVPVCSRISTDSILDEFEDH